MEIDLPRVTMEVSCSKGTYIAHLSLTLGKKLGCGACMESLLRTKVSRFELEDSLTLGEIEKKKQDGTLMEAIIPIDACSRMQECGCERGWKSVSVQRQSIFPFFCKEKREV